MRLQKISMLVAAAALFSTAASAADLPARPVYKAPVSVAPVFSWTGFYLGANLGYGWGSGSGLITVTGLGTGPVSGSGSGILGGLQAGYNWQTGPFVFGIEGDFQGSGAKGTTTAALPGGTIVATEKQPWFGTIRGRLGYAAFDRTMIYATGGGLYGKSELNGTGPVVGAFSASENYWTYVVGGGIETMFMPNWSAKLEYLYAGTPDNVPVPPGTTALTGSAHGNIVRAGVNYHF